MTSIRSFLIPPVLLASVLLGACGGDDDDAATDSSADTPAETSSETADDETPSEDAAGGEGTVTIERSRFAPEAVEVPAGTAVTFENLDPFAHTVTSAEGSAVEFDSGELGEDETFEQTFDEAGTYEYFCEIHPTMRAEVVVS